MDFLPKKSQTGQWIRVSIQNQTLELLQNTRVEKCYRISSSKASPSNLEHSLGTPSGWHSIIEKIGEKAPWGMVFKGRQPTQKRFWHWHNADENLITTRILRLEGLEDGINRGIDPQNQCCDSFKRYIYIHGTNREDLIGTPFSQGCILLKNEDMIDLFDRISQNTCVLINN